MWGCRPTQSVDGYCGVYGDLGNVVSLVVEMCKVQSKICCILECI